MPFKVYGGEYTVEHTQLSNIGFEIQEYADDIAILIPEKFRATVFERLQVALNIVARGWNLTMESHKAGISLWTSRSIIGKTWGIYQNMTRWLNTMINGPIISLCLISMGHTKACKP